jgi:hypothetical protein
MKINKVALRSRFSGAETTDDAGRAPAIKELRNAVKIHERRDYLISENRAYKVG